MKMKQQLKRVLSLIVALFLFAGLVATNSQSVKAANETGTFRGISFSFSNNTKGYPLNNNGNLVGLSLLGLSSRNEAFFCVEPHNPVSLNYYRSSAQYDKEFIQSILEYGYGGGSFDRAGIVGEDQANYIATQVLIWEVVTNERDANFELKSDAVHINRVFEVIPAALKGQVEQRYNEIINNVKHPQSKLPDFMKESHPDTILMDWVDSKYILTFKDRNGLDLSKYTFSSSEPDLKFTTNRNTLTVWSDHPILNTIQISASKDIETVEAVYVWESTTDGQRMIQPIKGNKTVTGYLNLKTPVGKIDIEKNTVVPYEADKLDGFGFTLYEIMPDGNEVVVGSEKFTSVEGTLGFDMLHPGDYLIRETTCPEFFQSQGDIAFTVQKNGDTTINNTIIETPVSYTNTYIEKWETETGWAGWVTDQGNKKNPGTFQRWGSPNTVKNGVSRTGQSSWSMAVDIPDENETIVDIVVGQHNVVGKVNVSPEIGLVNINHRDLVSTLNATARVNIIHFETGTTIQDFRKGNGQFSLTNKVIMLSDGTYQLPLKEYSPNATMFAAHFEFGYDANYDLLQEWLRN